MSIVLEAVSADLRATSTKELEAKVIALASFPILELPQTNDEEPIMDLNEETGLERLENHLLYFICWWSRYVKARVNITADMLQDWKVLREQLIGMNGFAP